jgi:quercetin dioxygenase-like cupin family protein
MKTFDARLAAAEAVAPNQTRPATAVVLDTPDARMIVFRIAPGQAVAPHRNRSTVILTVLSGQGLVSGAEAERAVSAGDVVTYEPNELHGMRAVDEELVLLATITPRPGTRIDVPALSRDAGAAPAEGAG